MPLWAGVGSGGTRSLPGALSESPCPHWAPWRCWLEPLPLASPQWGRGHTGCEGGQRPLASGHAGFLPVSGRLSGGQAKAQPLCLPGVRPFSWGPPGPGGSSSRSQGHTAARGCAWPETGHQSRTSLGGASEGRSERHAL